jgi:hypothetical protein
MVTATVPRRPSSNLMCLAGPLRRRRTAGPARPERLDGGEDLLIVTHPRTMVNSAQSDELTARDLVRQVAAVARRQPYLLAPADHQRRRADLTEHGADVAGGQRPGNPELRSPSPASLADSRQAKPDMRPIRGMSERSPGRNAMHTSACRTNPIKAPAPQDLGLFGSRGSKYRGGVDPRAIYATG